MMPPKSKILLTGANGQVGYCLLQKMHANVELLATNSKMLDITKQQDVFHTVQKFAPDIIINAAAYTAVDQAESDQKYAQAVNADAVKCLAQAAQSVNAACIHISTDYVFDGLKSSPYKEIDAVNPQSVYGLTKLAGEQAVLFNCDKAIILRTSWVFAEHGKNFVKTMLRLGQERDELKIVSDQLGMPTYAGDIAETIVTIIKTILSKQAINYGIYHYSGEPAVSWYDFAKYIFQQAKQQGVITKIPVLNPIKTSEYPLPAKRPANSCLDCSKIQKQFLVKPSNWQQALQNIQLFNL